MENNEVTISIIDFQIIEKATLSFRKGLNCIIGPSNNGKSAIFRAAKAAIYNEPGTTSIRNGRDSYKVGIQVGSNIVIFNKGKKESFYKVNGVKYEKPGRTQLPEVVDALGIRELNLNNINEQINFLDQMEKPFLLDRTETDLFRFIVDSGKDNRTTLALKDMTQDRLSKSKSVDLLQGAIEQLDSSIRTYEDDLEGSEKNLALCKRIIDLGPIIKRNNEIKCLLLEINSLKLNLGKKNNILSSIESLLGPILLTIQSIEINIDNIKSIETLIEQIKKSKNTIESLSQRVFPVKDLIESNKVNKLEVLVNGSNMKKDLLIKISKGITVLDLYNNLIDSYKTDEITKKRKNLESTVIKFNKIKEVKEGEEAREEVINKLKSGLEGTVLELKNIEKELKAFKICPLCHKPLEA